MAIEPILDLMHQRRSEAAKLARALYGNSVRPIYLRLADGRPMLVGSGILLEIDGVRCLATAAHVIDEHKQGSLHLGGFPSPVALNATFSWTVAGDGDHAADHVDVAIARLDDAIVEGLGGLPFIGMSDQVSEPENGGYETLLVTGFRSSQNKTPFHGVKDLKPMRWSFTGRRAAVPDADKRFDEGAYNFGVEYPQKAKRPNGEVVVATPPNGVSGGGVFDLGNLADIPQLASPKPPRPKLAGIFIECREHTLIATNLGAVYGCFNEFGSKPVTQFMSPNSGKLPCLTPNSGGSSVCWGADDGGQT